jgi:hypothetical protein
MAVVTAADGAAWTVRRRWDPRNRAHGPRFRPRRTDLWTELGKSGKGDVVEGAGCLLEAEVIGLVLLAAIVVALAAWFFLIPLILFLGEFVLLVVLVAASVVGRVLFKRPWVIEAVGPMEERHRWEVVGWRASGDHAALVAQQLRDGLPLPDEVVG